MEKILKFFLILAGVVFVVVSMLVFSYFINKQSKLDMKELEEIVEKEIKEKHEKQN